MKFSILIVTLNAGEKLNKTLESISLQTIASSEYEVIVKDGNSTDGSTECVKNYPDMNIRLYAAEDKGIYDAMNQAASYAQGDFVYFLNCGDYFAANDVLTKVANYIDRLTDSYRGIFYGNILERVTGALVTSNPKIDGFGCYRNVPCHQACFYKRELVVEHPFDLAYKVRADYEQFLWCYYIAHSQCHYMNFVIADYEGGGFSESKEHIKLSKKEHRMITAQYMKKSELLRYRFIMFITLAPLRTAIARNKVTAGIYNKFKTFLYKK